MDKQKIISGNIRALLFALIDLASNIDSGGEDFQIEMKISGGEVIFDPVEIADLETSEPATRKALKLNETLEDAGYPKVSGARLTIFSNREFDFSLDMEDCPDEEQKQVISAAFDGGRYLRIPPLTHSNKWKPKICFHKEF